MVVTTEVVKVNQTEVAAVQQQQQQQNVKRAISWWSVFAD
jgi:hypothetical protein